MKEKPAPLLSPTLSGGRFSNGEVPLDVLGDLVSFQSLLTELAKHIYRMRNHRRRVPAGFNASIRLAIVNISTGSSIIGLARQPSPRQQADLRYLDVDGAQGIHSWDHGATLDQLLLEGNELLGRAVESLSDGNGVPADFPEYLLPHLSRLGRGLRPEEYIDFRTDPKIPRRARFDHKARQRLRQVYGQTYEEPATLRGRVVGGLAVRQEITVEIDGGKLIPCRCSSRREAEKWMFLTGSSVVVSGMAEFSATGHVNHFVSAEEIALTSAVAPIDVQLEDIRRLEAGWFDGDNSVVSPILLDYFGPFLVELLEQLDIPVPAVFATPDGGLRAEWGVGDAEISIAAEAFDVPLYFHMVHARTGVDADVEIATQPRGIALAGAIKFLEPLFP